MNSASLYYISPKFSLFTALAPHVTTYIHTYIHNSCTVVIYYSGDLKNSKKVFPKDLLSERELTLIRSKSLKLGVLGCFISYKNNAYMYVRSYI